MYKYQGKVVHGQKAWAKNIQWLRTFRDEKWEEKWVAVME